MSMSSISSSTAIPSNIALDQSSTMNLSDIGKNAAALQSASGATAVAQSASTVVTLSPSAQALAKLSAKGITVFQTSAGDINLGAALDASSNDAQLKDLLGSALITPPTAGNGEIDGVVSQDDFLKIVLQYHATQTSAIELFQTLDSNHDGLVSNDELLGGLSDTAKDGTSPSSQNLLNVMDTNSDHSVSGAEYMQFETAFVRAEKPPTS